jgi:RNA polymerase sigma-70 factor (ECF subfamily)
MATPKHLVSVAPDEELVAALRAGDERVFTELVEHLHPALVRLARSFVGSAKVAEEVAQEAWTGVLHGIDSFEGRSPLKAWIFGILVDRASGRAGHELRIDTEDPAVDADRFLDLDHPRWPHHWAQPPRPFGELGSETRTVIEHSIETLPPAQRQVIALRDIDGLDSEEVCALLGLSAGNQRVLLHRARSHVRRDLERYLEGEPA